MTFEIFKIPILYVILISDNAPPHLFLPVPVNEGAAWNFRLEPSPIASRGKASRVSHPPGSLYPGALTGSTINLTIVEGRLLHATSYLFPASRDTSLTKIFSHLTFELF